MITIVPSWEHIKASIFEMNENVAPGPDELRGHFYQFSWYLVDLYVINPVQNFFITGKLQHNIDVNILILILKYPRTDKTNLGTWKDLLLSFMRKVQLVRSIIHGLFIYYFHFYL